MYGNSLGVLLVILLRILLEGWTLVGCINGILCPQWCSVWNPLSPPGVSVDRYNRWRRRVNNLGIAIRAVAKSDGLEITGVIFCLEGRDTIDGRALCAIFFGEILKTPV